MNARSKSNRLLAKSFLYAIAVIGCSVWCIDKCQAEQSMPIVANNSRPALTVRITTMRQDKWAQTLTANGSVLPWQEAIISAQMQGVRISDVKVSIGDKVHQGDVLLTLDNYINTGNIETAHSIQGQVLAPDDGVISSSSANVGSMMQSGAELFRLIRKGRLEWRAELTAEELMLLRKDMPVKVTVGESRTINGIVRAISPSVSAQTRYGYALISLQDSSGIIAGAFAHGTFDISGGKKNMQTLPQSSVMQRGSISYVLIVNDDNHVHERVVTVGQRIGDRIQIKQGLKANEPVIESGGAFLTDGDIVRVVKD
jgi:multidrug efflux pump subunit AcrA (membrane-fusion protein)